VFAKTQKEQDQSLRRTKELKQTINMLPPSIGQLQSNHLNIFAHQGECVLGLLITLQLRPET